MVNNKKAVMHVCNKETEIALIKNNQDYQTKMLEEMHHRIIGNGKPGILADIQELQTTQKDYKETKVKVEKMNNNMYYAMGIFAVIMILIGIFGSRIAAAVLG